MTTLSTSITRPSVSWMSTWIISCLILLLIKSHNSCSRLIKQAIHTLFEGWKGIWSGPGTSTWLCDPNFWSRTLRGNSSVTDSDIMGVTFILLLYTDYIPHLPRCFSSEIQFRCRWIKTLAGSAQARQHAWVLRQQKPWRSIELGCFWVKHWRLLNSCKAHHSWWQEFLRLVCNWEC